MTFTRDKTIIYSLALLFFLSLLAVALRYAMLSEDKFQYQTFKGDDAGSTNSLTNLLLPLRGKPIYGMSPFQYLEKHDPIYANILHGKTAKLSPLAREIVCTPHFQRLYKVAQLGSSFIAFEHALGSRASHCKGVGQLAATFATVLAENSGIALHPAEIIAVQVAGLLHDIGHGPSSHLFEPIADRAMRPNGWDHETNSKNIVKYLFKQNERWSAEYSLPEDFVEVVCDMIIGIKRETFQAKYSTSGVFQHFFIFTIVNAVHAHRLDVDKMDYLMRDSYLTTKLGFCETVGSHIEKLILNAKVIDDAVAFSAGTSYDLYQTARAYYLLYRYVYFTPIAVGTDLLLKDAFGEIEPALDLKNNLVSLEKFASLTDSFIEYVASYALTQSVRYPKAAVLFERFLKGQAYELGGYRDFFYGQFDMNGSGDSDIVSIATKKMLKATSGAVEEDDFIFIILNLTFLFKRTKNLETMNPLKRIPLYGGSFLQTIFEPSLTYANGYGLFSSSAELDFCGYESTMHPVYFGSIQLRLYIKTLDPAKRELVKGTFETLSFESPIQTQ